MQTPRILPVVLRITYSLLILQLYNSWAICLQIF